MRRNRFEQVDEIQDDAITLEMSAEGDSQKARVHVAAAFMGESGEASVSEPLPKVDAFRGAIKLANTLKAPVVVIDAWDAIWGDLYRPV